MKLYKTLTIPNSIYRNRICNNYHIDSFSPKRAINCYKLSETVLFTVHKLSYYTRPMRDVMSWNVLQQRCNMPWLCLTLRKCMC